MSIITAFALSLLFFAATGCAASGSSPAAPSAPVKQKALMKPAQNDEGRSMNEESQNAVMDR